MGVLGLVCRLYSERDHGKEDKTGEGEKEGEPSSVKKEVDGPQTKPKCRIIKIEREEDASNDESELGPQHDSNEDEEEELLSEEENEYYWD